MTKSSELNQHLFPQILDNDDLITIYNTAKNLTATGAAFPDDYGTDFYWPQDNMSVDPDGVYLSYNFIKTSEHVDGIVPMYAIVLNNGQQAAVINLDELANVIVIFQPESDIPEIQVGIRTTWDDQDTVELTTQYFNNFLASKIK